MSVYAVGWGLNVVDFLIVILIAAVLYFGKKDGFVAELFKLFGVYLTIFITLHYYARLATFLKDHTFAKDAVTEIFAFCVMGIFLFVAFVAITKGWELILKVKSFDFVDRWGYLVLSLIRCYLISSMVFLSFLVSESDGFLKGQAKQSVSWHLFRMGAVEVYRASYNGIVVKLVPGEPVNKKIFGFVEADSPEKIRKK